MKIVYHNDMDGRCSAAIVYRYHEIHGNDCPAGLPMKLIYMNTYKEFDICSVEKDEKVYILDCSLRSLEEYEKLLTITKNVIWIDHHKTSIDQYDKFDLLGYRVDGTAACILTWKYLFGDNIPDAVKYLGDYDVFKFDFGERSKYFHTVTDLYDTRPNSKIWLSWLDVNYDCINELYDGKICFKYKTNRERIVSRAIYFEATFEGYNCICCNQPLSSSLLFDSVYDEKKHDLMINFFITSSGYKVSIYNNKGIDSSLISKKYGGGGHPGASGFSCKQLNLVNGVIEVIQ
jgi:oligoribonuclease NrnB/cAMP/cGMP phosphodiesterase (DHH superfamily)